MLAPVTAREAAERNAQAVVAGNLPQIMADMTPEALTQMIQMSASAGALAPAQMPTISAYELTDAGQTEDGQGQVFQVAFTSPIGTATVAETWRQVVGQWKISAVQLVSAEPAATAND